jgi:DNA-binding GntR family transcriptional regulator
MAALACGGAMARAAQFPERTFLGANAPNASSQNLFLKRSGSADQPSSIFENLALEAKNCEYSGMIAIGDVSRTLADEAYSRIRSAMHSGQLEPGQRLRFSDLQALTDTSVTPVREALARLTAEGFTELEGHRGYRVAPVSSEDLWDVVKNRQQLESEALRLSIELGDDHWEAQLISAHHLLSRMDRERADLPTAVNEQWEKRHDVFHETLIGACHSKVLLSFCSQLSGRANRYRRLSISAPPRDIKTEHRLIFEATIGRDAQTATRLLRDHFERTARMVDELLKNKW